ncbi:MAG: LytTR family DNA-binding domain-containing protein [Bacteroidota bacterium]
MTLTCLIVDDEQLARDMLERYVSQIQDLFLLGKCKNARETEQILTKESVDLLLLDIQMPAKTGLDFLRTLEKRPMVILTTAYSDYALQGYELEVVDYLLKPIGFSRFEKAIEKARDLMLTKQKAMAFEAQNTYEKQSLLIKDGYKHHTIFLKDIQYIAAMREYVQYHTNKGKFMELRSLSKLELSLPQEHFLRIHRSYIVAESFVSGQEKNSLLLRSGTKLPIGKTYKQRVLKFLFSEKL